MGDGPAKGISATMAGGWSSRASEKRGIPSSKSICWIWKRAIPNGSRPATARRTCAWIHPQSDKVLYASTHEDPKARDKQQEELKLRESGQERRYAWDYDEHYEIYEWDRKTGQSTNLTKTLGYDAEGSYSPDGKLIAFTSNRRAYGNDLTEEERKAFAQDPATMNDIYRMDADGSHVTRLTTAPGYDGGPFFRSRRAAHLLASIHTRRRAGRDYDHECRWLGSASVDAAGHDVVGPVLSSVRQVLIFTTNRHGFANFELYLVDSEGKSAPVRVTYTTGFDGLPVFTPDGQHLAWTSNRTASKQSQIFLADWNDQRARRTVGPGPRGGTRPRNADGSAEHAARSRRGENGVRTRSSRRSRQTNDRRFLAARRPAARRLPVPSGIGGRLTGTEGERLATAYVAAYLEGLGLQAGGR